MNVSVIGLFSWGFAWFETERGFMWGHKGVMIVSDVIDGGDGGWKWGVRRW